MKCLAIAVLCALAAVSAEAGQYRSVSRTVVVSGVARGGTFERTTVTESRSCQYGPECNCDESCACRQAQAIAQSSVQVVRVRPTRAKSVTTIRVIAR